jgi:hypothetical protein
MFASKAETGPEKPARDKRHSLLQTFLYAFKQSAIMNAVDNLDSILTPCMFVLNMSQI